MPILWSGRKARENPPNVWTADDIERLKELLFARVRVCEIARELGRTEGAVRTRAQQLGISLRALRGSGSAD